MAFLQAMDNSCACVWSFLLHRMRRIAVDPFQRSATAKWPAAIFTWKMLACAPKRYSKTENRLPTCVLPRCYPILKDPLQTSRSRDAPTRASDLQHFLSSVSAAAWWLQRGTVFFIAESHVFQEQNVRRHTRDLGLSRLRDAVSLVGSRLSYIQTKRWCICIPVARWIV